MQGQRMRGRLKNKNINAGVSLLIYLYLTLPTLIFLAGWLKWYWALLFGSLTAVSCVRAFASSMRDKDWVPETVEDPDGTKIKTFAKALLFILLWVYLSGIGGWCYQNRDHEVRSAIFRALVEYDWPVISHDGSRGLIYYIGFWLPSACIGKVFGLEAGYAAQIIWAVTGIFIVYYLICVYRKKADLLPIAFLVFFSGLDYVGAWILGEEELIRLSLSTHLEWWAVDFQFTSMTAQLFWVFNQAVPAWVATIAVMTQKNCKNMLFILALTMLSSTIPFVGLIPIVIYLYIKRVMGDKKRWKEIFTLQNIVGVMIIGGCVFLYLTGNVSGGMIQKDNAALAVREPAALWLRYLLFYLLEFGIYLYFICRYRKKDSLVYLLTAILLICPFIKVGNDHDFCMRASLPALFILMLLCMETFEKIRLEGKKYLLAAYCVVLLLGSLTAVNEIRRSVKETYWRVTYGESVRYPETGIEKDLLRNANFSGETQGNIFYRYFARMYSIYEKRE